MNIITGGRQSGRTTKLIEMAAEAEAKGQVCYIVCHSQKEAYRIADQARKMELSIGFPITYDEFLTMRGRGFIHHFYIDNVEFLLARLTTVPIEAVTITTEK